MFRALGLFLVLCTPAYTQSAVFDWVRQIGGSNGQAIAGIATDPAGNTYVVGNTLSVDYPTTSSAYQPNPGGAGLYRVDGPGNAWKSLPGSGFVAVSRLAANPSAPSVIYAAGQPGLQRSTDGGDTWTGVGNFPTAVNDIALDSAGALYVATAGSGLFKSLDGGTTFSPVNNGLTPDPVGRLYFNGVWTDPTHASVVFAAQNTGLLKSSDGGATWQPITQFQGAVSLSFDANTPGAIYAIAGADVFASTDDGQTWTLLPPLGAPDPLITILVDPKTPGTLWGGSPGGPGFGGLWKSTDNGQTWTRIVNTSASALAGDPLTGAVYAATGDGLLVSTDEFKTVTQIGPPSIAGINSLLPIAGRLFVGAVSSTDVFVAKFDPQGNTVYSTYFGGASSDVANAIALDANGALYVTGVTSSIDFPVTAGAFAKAGTSFLFKLNPDGALGYSTYFTTNTSPLALAVDAGGHAYLAGYSLGRLPTTPGAYETTLQGSYPSGFYLGPGPGPIINAFLTEFDAKGSSLVFSTYIGSYTAFANVISLDQQGNAYLAGGQTLYKMSPDGSSLLQTISAPGSVWSLLVDPVGNLYAGGVASSGVPTTSGAFQTSRYGVPGIPGNLALTPAESGFIIKYDAGFNVLNATYLSGEVDDRVLALALASNGNIIAGGFTQSKAFPARGPVQSSFANGTGFIAELSPDLTSLQFSTFAGDTRPFVITAVAPTPDGGAMFAGATTSTLPFFAVSGNGVFNSGTSNPTSASVQSFVVRVGAAPAMPRIDAVANAASRLPVALSPGATFTVRGQGFGADSLLTLNGASIPLLSQTATSLTAVVPADIAMGVATVQVASGGASSNSVLVPVASAAPGVFSADGSGLGQGYILNADGSRNSPSNPAKEGDAITIFATGVGPVSFTDGYAVLSSPPNVFVDGFYANGIAATFGPVTGLTGNVYRISVYIPRPSDYANVNPNLQGFVMPPQVAVTLQVNGVYSQAGLALSVTQ
ncbi:MAG TPA: SBBP repeat-containing protein [Verrucomicrobiae bacterium]|nr:SBBP repeat-containing protein [Verrucomicrobiae bacterium]